MKVYLLVMENYEDETEIKVYSTEEKAKKALEKIKNKYKNYDEFHATKNGCSWFNPEWNAFSTSVYITSEKVL